MNESVMRLWTLLTVAFAVSTTLWLAGMVQVQQTVDLEADAAPARSLSVALASTRLSARSVERAASGAMSYAVRLR